MSHPDICINTLTNNKFITVFQHIMTRKALNRTTSTFLKQKAKKINKKAKSQRSKFATTVVIQTVLSSHKKDDILSKKN